MGSAERGGAGDGGARVHGGALAAGLDPASVLDLSVNVNPYGPAAAVLAAIRAAPVHLYPDPGARAVREAIARASRWAPEGVVFGSGGADLLWTVARVVLRPGDRALAVEPAFSELRAAAEAAGAEVASWRADAGSGWRLHAEAAAAAARACAARLVYLAAPFAATGVAVPLEDVEQVARALPETVVVLDESFAALSDTHGDLGRPLPPHVARLRSMTKEHAMPGLRAGYLLASPELARRVERTRPAWSTSAPAQAAALAALAEDAFVARSRELLRADRAALVDGLRALGLTPLPSAAPYVCFPAGGGARAAALGRALLERGVLVRDCASFGLPGFLRVAARPAAERARFLAALREALAIS